MDPSIGGGTHRDGLRHVRRMSNWTAAVLIAGTGTATAALAHQAPATRDEVVVARLRTAGFTPPRARCDAVNEGPGG